MLRTWEALAKSLSKIKLHFTNETDFHFSFLLYTDACADNAYWANHHG